MAKLRSNPAWAKLTAEQRGRLEAWLFEKHLSYRETLELARREFGLATSLTSLKVYAQRLKGEREAREMTRELAALMESGGKGGKTLEQVRAAGEKMAVMKMFELSMRGPGNAREIALLLRAMVEGQKVDLEKAKFERKAPLEDAAGKGESPQKSA
jgi:hypothetical protein